jgi:hypothetical protein
LIAYADTGFLISAYGRDPNSSSARSLLASKPVLILTPFGEGEFTNAIELLVFRKHWTPSEAHIIHEAFLGHQAAGVFQAQPLGSEVWQQAIALSRRHSAVLGTRMLDILHVASALLFKPDAFYTFDKRQAKLARAEGLSVLPAEAKQRQK